MKMRSFALPFEKMDKKAAIPVSAYVMMHTAVVLYGVTAILGRLITLPGTTLVWYRMGITLLSLLLFPRVIAHFRAFSPREKWQVMGNGVLLTIHWMTFYEAIKYSNASIALSVLASTAFFTSLFEPLFFGRKIQLREALLGLMVVGGFVFIFGFSAQKYLTGILIALVSAILVAMVGVLNKSVASKHPAESIIFAQFIGGFVFLTAFMPVYLRIFPDLPFIPTRADWGWLLILSLLCTTLAYYLTMRAMRHVSAFTSNLAINLEPVYGMLMAAAIFKENKDLNGGFYIGAGIILLTVVVHAWMGRKR